MARARLLIRSLKGGVLVGGVVTGAASCRVADNWDSSLRFIEAAKHVRRMSGKFLFLFFSLVSYLYSEKKAVDVRKMIGEKSSAAQSVLQSCRRMRHF